MTFTLPSWLFQINWFIVAGTILYMCAAMWNILRFHDWQMGGMWFSYGLANIFVLLIELSRRPTI